MMFLQRYVHVVLDAVLGSYVKNIDPETLKISVWNGKIEIDVVELLPDAVPLPPEFRIVKATLHNVRVDLPWSNLANQPIRVDVQDVNVLLEVCDRRPGAAADAAAAHEKNATHAAKRRAETLKRKRATIDAIEKATQASEAAPTSVVTTDKTVGKSMPWTQTLLFKLLVKVLDNVQLNVQHIHLRMEDRVSAPSRPFAVGVTLESMVLKSADAGWNYTMSVRGAAQTPRTKAAAFLRKKIDINKFGLYWSLPLSPVPPTALVDATVFMRHMQSNFSSADDSGARLPKLFEPSDYVIEPMTLSLKLTVNDGRAKLPITHAELCARVMTRLGTPWKVHTITAIGDEAWQEFVDGMPKLAGGRMYTLTFVFSEAWAVAREQNEEEDMVPSVEQFKDALASCLQWSRSAVDRLEASISKYRDAVIHVLQEKSTYIDASASVDHINVAIQRQQYLSGLNLVSFLGVKRRQARYAKLRPAGVHVTAAPRQWWRYAISAVLLDVRERLARVDTEEVLRLKAKRSRFKDLYIVTTSPHGLPPGLVSLEVAQLSKDMARKELEDLEVVLDIQEMLQLRKSARQAVIEFATKPKPAPSALQTKVPADSTTEAAPPPSSRLWSYTSWFYGGGNGRDAPSGKADNNESLEWSDQDTKTFFDAIDYDPEDGENNEVGALESWTKTNEHIWYRCHFSLSKTRLRLLGEDVDGRTHQQQSQWPLAAVALDNVDFKVLIRPATVEVGIKLGDASVFGLTNLTTNKPRVVVQRMQVDEIVTHHPKSISDNMSCVRLRACERVLPLIDIGIEVKTSSHRKTTTGVEDSSDKVSSAHDVAISVVAQAMKCDVDVEALLRMASFFARPSHVDLTGLRDRAWRQAQNLQRYSAAQVHAALARRSNVELLVDVISPLVTVKQSPSPAHTDDRPRLVVFLGHLRASSRRGADIMVANEAPNGNADVSMLTSPRNEDHLYDAIDVGLSAIEVRLSDEADTSSIPTHLLEKTSVRIGIFLSIAPNDPTVPLVKIVGGVDSVQVNLNTKTFSLLVRLLRSIGDDFNRVRELRPGDEDTDVEPKKRPSTTISSTSDIEKSLEASAAVSYDDEPFFSGFETDTKLNSHSSMPRSGLRRSVSAFPASPAASALYGVFSEVRESDRHGHDEKEIADSDLLKLWRRILLLVRFQIREVAITLNLASQELGENGKAIRVCMTTIKTELDVRTYDKLLRFAVGSFAVEERRERHSSRFLIASGDLINDAAADISHHKDGQLIQLSIASVDPDAPKPKNKALWASLRDSGGSADEEQTLDADHTVWQDPLVTWLSVDARLCTLVLNLHQDAFADLFLFFHQGPPEEQEELPSVPPPRTSGPSSVQVGSGGGRPPLVRKIAKSPEVSEKSAPPSNRMARPANPRQGLTSKIGTWVASSLAERMSMRRLPIDAASSPPPASAEESVDRSPARMQLRLHVAGLSVVLHQAPSSAETREDSVFVRLEAKDFSCCLHRFPEHMSLFAYLVSMRISDETVPEQSLQEILGSETRQTTRRSHRSSSEEGSAAHVPTVEDVLRAVNEVPAIFSCAAQLYGADRIQELWHPGYANRFSVRLNSPRIRVLYRFLDDLRAYFMDGVLLQTVMATLFPHRVQIAWDPEFLVSSFSSQHASSATLHGASPRKPFAQLNAASDVVSMFPLLDVRLVDAKLHIPVHRASTEALVVRFDLFHLTNEYLLDMFSNMNNHVMAKVLLNSSLCQLKMDLDTLRVVSVILVDSPIGQHAFHHMSGQSGKPELLTQSLLGSTSMTVSADFANGKATTVGFELTPVRVVCNREQYAFLLRLPIQNFGEARQRSRVAQPDQQVNSSSAMLPSSPVNADPELVDEEEGEIIVTVKVPAFAMEILHGQEGYQPSTSGDMSMAEAEKRADGSICVVDVAMFSASVHYGLSSRSLRVSSEIQSMRIRDTRKDAQISSSYRDVVVFTPPNVAGVPMPSISIRVLHGFLDASDQQERALECSFAMPQRRQRPTTDSQESSAKSGKKLLRKMSTSFFGSDTLVGFHPPNRVSSSVSSVPSFGRRKSVESDGASDHTETNGSTPKSSSRESRSGRGSIRTDLIVDVEGFRIIPSNIHYDVLRFLESPGRGAWDSESISTQHGSERGSTTTEAPEEETGEAENGARSESVDHPRRQHYVVVSLTLGRSAVLLVEDPSKVLSRAVMFSWEASIMVEFLRRPTVVENTSANHRLQVRLDLANIQATSRLSQENMWARGNDSRVGASPSKSTASSDIAGDFLKPCDLECRLDVDFATGFVRLKTAFDRVLDLRFGYLDVCSLRSAIEQIIAYPSVKNDSAPTSSSAPFGRRFSVGSSIGSSSSALVAETDGVTTITSVAALSEYGDAQSNSHRRRRRDRNSEPMLQYGTTLVYLVSATFRGPLNVRPAIGLYSSPWRKRYLVLPFTAQERQSVEPTMFRIVPAAGSRRTVGDPIRFGDRIGLEAVQSSGDDDKKQSKSGGAVDGEERDPENEVNEDKPEITTSPICKYDQLGASGYLGPDGSAGVFETRIWKYGTSAFNSDRGPIRHKDAIVLEELTIYRAFSKGKSLSGSNRLVSAQFDLMDNGDNARMGSEGGGYLMFNGVGDAPIPVVVSVKSATSAVPNDVEAAPVSRSKSTEEPASTRSQQQRSPSSSSTAVALWGKLKVFQFNLPGVNATVVNDFHNMLLPLLHLRVVQLTVDLRGSFESRLTAMASLQVGIQNYNSQLAVWEPLVEDFDVNFAIHLKGGAICDFCMSDRKQISVAGTKLRCDGIPHCLFGATKTVAFAPAAARASETKHFIYQELLQQQGSAVTTSGNHDDDAKVVPTCLLAIKKGITINVSRTGVNVLLQFVDLVSRAASNAEQDAWRSRLGAFVYVDNQSGIPFLVAGQPTQSPPVSSSSSASTDNFGAELRSQQSSIDDSGDEMVKLPTLSVGSEEGLLGVASGGITAGIGTSTLEPTSWIDNRQLTAVMKDMMASSTAWLTVSDGQRVATNIVAHEAPAGSVASPLRRLLWLRPKSSSSSSKPIPVPIGYSNRSYVHLESRSGFKDPWHGESIICETVAEQGTLVMRLRGKVQLVNHLSFPVQVVYNDQRREVLAAEGRSPHFVPIQYLDGGNMTLCPMLDSGQLQASTHLSIASLLRAPVVKKKTAPATALSGALEVRKVLTFYWDEHPDEPQGFSNDFVGVARPPFQLILTASRKSEKHEAIITISAPIRLENLVPFALAFRTVCTKSERDLAWVKDNLTSFSGTSGVVASGHVAQICELEIFNDRSNAGQDTIQVPAAVALSIAIPTIGYDTFSAWTETSFIYGSDRTCSRIELTKTAEPTDSSSTDLNALQLRVEIVTTERLGTVTLNRLAPSVCRIYAEYWLIDRTSLSIVMRTPEGRRVEPWVSTEESRAHHAPVALFSSHKTAPIHQRIKIGVRGGTTGGSDIESNAFDISTVGLRGKIKLRSGGRSKSAHSLPSLRLAELTGSISTESYKQFDIGVMIEQGPSMFSRTTVVTFVPRYYFINTSDRFQIMIKQERDSDSNAVALAPRQGCFFHWPDSRLRNRVQIRFVCVQEECNGGIDYEEEEEKCDGEEKDAEEKPHGVSEWSLPFEVTSVGNFVVRLHRALSRAPLYFGDSCFASDDTHPNDSATSSPYVGQCEVLTGVSLHVGVELHDPAFVVRFHEGQTSGTTASNNDPDFDHGGGALESAQVKDFVSYKLKNECTALELFVWQKIPADASDSAGSSSRFSYEGGDRVFPFQTTDFVPFSASTAPILHVQLQTVLESASSLHNNNEEMEEDGDDATIAAGSHIAGVAPPRIVSSFEVALDKLHSLPVIEVHDGKTTKRLWVEVVLEDATKTLRVTDVLPGASGEHRRRRRAALLRSWKRYNASVLWYSRLLFDSHNKPTLPAHGTDQDEGESSRGDPSKQRKHVHFMSDANDGKGGDAESSDARSSAMAGETVVASRPTLIVAMRIVDAVHLEDIYPPETNASGVSPFIRARMRGNQHDATVVSRTLRTQSTRAVFPRWVPAKYARRKHSESASDSEVLLQRFSLDSDNDSETTCVELEVREGNRLLMFKSSVLGQASIPLHELLAAARKDDIADHTQQPVRVHELLVPIVPSSATVPANEIRSMVRVQIAANVCRDYQSTVLSLEEAIRNFSLEAQLDRLVRCKSQLKVLLERESVDLSLSDSMRPRSASPTTGVVTPPGSQSRAAEVPPPTAAPTPELKNGGRSMSVPSITTDDSGSDTANGILFDERVLSVVVMGVTNLQMTIPEHDDSDEPGSSKAQSPVSGDQKVYCTVSYKESTRAATSSVAKKIPEAVAPLETDDQQRSRRFVRKHQFTKGQALGLDLIYHSGRVVVQGVACNGPCGKLLQDGKICIGDTVVAVNDKSIVNLHRDASFRTIAQACSVAVAVVGKDPQKTFSLSFLRQSPSSFGPRVLSRGMHDDDPDRVAMPRYEAEWNRRVEFVDSNRDPGLDEPGTKKNKVLVRVYRRNELSDHGLTAAQESSVVPFLYFFGDEDTMDHLDHSKEDTRFDKLIGEAWVSVPTVTSSSSSLAGTDVLLSDEDQEPTVTECLCALYAPTSPETRSAPMHDQHIMAAARPMVGEVRLALKWEHRNSLARLRNQQQLRVYVQLEVHGVFISIIDDGTGGTQRRPPREVLSISLSARHADTGIQVSYGLVTDGRHVVNTRVGHMQVDNQLLDTNYPVMVFPIRLDDTVQQEQSATTSAASPTIGRNGKASPSAIPDAARKNASSDSSGTPRSDRILLPTFQLMGVFSKRRTLVQFDYIFVQLQELDVKLEDAVLVATAQALSGIKWSLLGYGHDRSDAASDAAIGDAALSLVDARWPFPATPAFPLSSMNVDHRGGNTKVLLRWLLFCPIKMNVTFTSTTDRANLLSLLSPEMSTVLRTMISAAAALVSNLDNAAIKVPEFYVENLLETTHTLAFYTMQHYVHHGLRSWYRIVGSVDFLGNPIGLVSALGAGVKDFFYTPAQMLLEDEDGLRIENLRNGMTKGSKSLFRNTAVGIFHTTGKITETLGKGIALLAMDDEYNVERQRQTTRQNKKINDLGDAIAEGGKGFVGGVWDGVKGVVSAPVRGAERDGAGGFVIGIGQGMAGLFVKPAAGFLDMLTTLSRGAKTSAEAIDGGYEHGYLAATRVRLPRRICADGVLVSFSEREARGCAILALTSLDLTDDYVYHLDYGLESQRGILLLTDKRMLCLSTKSGQKLWEVALDSSLQVETTGAVLSIAQSKTSYRTYKIECADETAAANFKLAVSSARLDLSATRYLLLNLEKKQHEARQNALLGVVGTGDAVNGYGEDGRVDLSLLMGNLQDTMVSGLSEDELRTQPLRSVHVELCHLENTDAAASVPHRTVDAVLSFSVFQILVYGGPYQWTVYRRFSEFRALYETLEKTGQSLEGLPPLPGRTFLPSTRSTVATHRQETLSLFLQAAIMHSSISGSQAMLEFLTRNAHEVRVSLPPLSPSAALGMGLGLGRPGGGGGGGPGGGGGGNPTGGGNGGGSVVGAASMNSVLRTP